MTKQNIKTYNWANLFANVNGGKPINNFRKFKK